LRRENFEDDEDEDEDDEVEDKDEEDDDDATGKFPTVDARLRASIGVGIAVVASGAFGKVVAAEEDVVALVEEFGIVCISEFCTEADRGKDEFSVGV
jgi:hypothetical protein